MSPQQGSNRGAIKTGFTVLELFIVIAIIGILIGMFLPAVRRTRSASRDMICQNNLRQVVLATHNYESAHSHFPAAMGGLEDQEVTLAHEGANRLSGLVLILPFLEQGQLYTIISNPSRFDGVGYPAGPAPWKPGYPPWQTKVQVFRCPGSENAESSFGQTNYAFSIGDVARQIHEPAVLRGAYACGINARSEDFKDGSSNTIAMAEIGTSSNRSIVGQFATQQRSDILDDPSSCRVVVDSARPGFYAATVKLGSPGRGACWADGAAGASLINTILPPNSPSCAVEGNQPADGFYSAGSSHSKGINVAMADGSTHFISEEIDAGDLGQPSVTPEQMSNGPTPSPYGVWGALGTIAGEEITSDDW